MSAKGFDKNSIIGLLLIGAILLVTTYLTQPSEEELKAKAEQEKQDKAKQEQVDEKPSEVTSENTDTVTANLPTTVIDSNKAQTLDSIQNIQTLVKYGSFANSSVGEKQDYIIENEKVKITISNKGGRVSTVELKEFNTYDSLPLVLFREDSSRFNIELTVKDGISGTKVINTEELFFET
ncbi:MAG: hypothetical protein P8Q14_01215, partial [Vicingaceae bacterium]|nr:hypothetical protein [Vicingaceae bacterium]